eukprot:TRINITY_DN22832_c0_g1_i1.p1 TRINITY_DN22832_c0_g1~~TRINITY_DN22832_c0_g1_i1.p1  ORF type:complete len:143 (+),score=21.81 TRINITY_DN22832_c0_g1_i1:47-475(+)
MRNRGDVEEILGKENVDVLRQAINTGKLPIDQIREIAVKMGGNVFGTFDDQNRRGEPPLAVFNMMLDTWYLRQSCIRRGQWSRRTEEHPKRCWTEAPAMKMTQPEPGVLKVRLQRQGQSSQPQEAHSYKQSATLLLLSNTLM